MIFSHQNIHGRFYRYNTPLEAMDFVRSWNGAWVAKTKLIRI